jgi:uncharacterized membrane protein YkvA (DUF1232 family)
MDLAEVEAVIESARSRGLEPLERFIARSRPQASQDGVAAMARRALEIIESVPDLLRRAAESAQEAGLQLMVGPVLEHATYYFLQPVDLIPEMTRGLAGLLDDSYLVLRVLQRLDQGPEPLVGLELDEPLGFLRSLVGEDLGRRLDAIALRAENEISQDLHDVWAHMTHRA